MLSFKTFLSEHIVYGQLKPGKNFAGIDNNNVMVFGTPSGNDQDYSLECRFTAKPIVLEKVKKFLVAEIPKIVKPSGYFAYSTAIEKLYDNFKDIDFNDWDVVVMNTVSDDVKKYALEKAKQYLTRRQYTSGISFKADTYGIRSEATPNQAVEHLLKNWSKLETPNFGVIVSVLDMIIDTTNQTIQMINRDKSYSSRMGTHGSKTRQYLLAFGDMRLSENDIVKMLSSLVKKFPEISQYTFIDVGSNGNDLAIIDVINGLGRVARQAKSFVDKSQNSINKTVVAYHGTSLENWEIIKKNGLRPGKGPQYVDKILNHSDHLVYMSTDVAEVRKYAVRAGQSKGSVILEIKIHDLSKLDFDEDQLWRVKNIPSNVKKLIAARTLQLFRDSLEQYDRRFTSVSAMGDEIFSNWGIWRYLFEKPLNVEQQKLKNLIGSYCITGAITFGYKGIILPKDIRVVEQFKSMAVNDSTSSKDYADKYDKVVSKYKWFH